MRRDDELQELLERLDIQSWLDSQAIDYTTGRGRSGTQLNVRVCPVCGNGDKKVYLNAETGLGNCFAGSHPHGETFNKWKFIRAHLGDVSGQQVVQHIKSFVSDRGWMPKRQVVAKVQQPVQLALPASVSLPWQGRNIKYLTNRGIPGELAAYFHLRYCDVGVFPYQHEGGWRNMPFDKRVIVPIFDLDGKMVTFQGRDVTGTAERKYLFPPGLAAAGAHLLNGMNVAPGTKRIVVGEGAFDVMAIKLAFDADPSLRDVVPVGTFGKHLSLGSGDSQEAKFLALKERGVEEVTFMWDGEVGATDDAIAAGNALRKHGLKVRIAMLPAGKDPNEIPAGDVRQAFYTARLLTPASAVQICMLRRTSMR